MKVGEHVISNRRRQRMTLTVNRNILLLLYIHYKYPADCIYNLRYTKLTHNFLFEPQVHKQNQKILESFRSNKLVKSTSCTEVFSTEAAKQNRLPVAHQTEPHTSLDTHWAV